MKQVFFSNNTTALSTTAAQFAGLMYGGNAAGINISATETNKQYVMPIAGTFRNLRVDTDTAPGAAKSRVFTARKNASNQALTATVSGTNVTASDVTNSFDYVAGDLISMGLTTSGTPAASVIRWSVESEGTTANQFFTASTPGAPSTTATQYTQVIDGGDWSATYANRSNLIPGSCAFKTLYVSMGTAPGVAKTWTFTIMRNGTAQVTSAVAVTGAATTGNSVGLTIDYVPGDTIALQSVPAGTPASSKMMFGFGFEAVTDGESIIGGNSNVNDVSQSVTNYLGLSQAFTAPSATETDFQQLSGPTSWVMKNFRVLGDTPPGAGNSYTIQLRKNAGDGNSNVVLSGAAGTSGVDAVNTDTIVNGNLIDISTVPVSTPDLASFKWAGIQFIDPNPATGRKSNLTNLGIS